MASRNTPSSVQTRDSCMLAAMLELIRQHRMAATTRANATSPNPQGLDNNPAPRTISAAPSSPTDVPRSSLSAGGACINLGVVGEAALIHEPLGEAELLGVQAADLLA